MDWGRGARELPGGAAGHLYVVGGWWRVDCKRFSGEMGGLMGVDSFWDLDVA
jgi:hypothetical protein